MSLSLSCAFVLVVLLIQSCLTFEVWNNDAFQIITSTSNELNDNWLKVKPIFDKMAPHLEVASMSAPHDGTESKVEEKVTFQDVVVVNWLSDLDVLDVTEFSTLNEDVHGDNDFFNLDEKVFIVNYTIPQLLFSARFLFDADGKLGTIHCAIDNLPIGMFIHHSKTNKIIYIDNFQMAPPEKSYVLISNTADNLKIDSKTQQNLGYDDDTIQSEWKLAIWLTTYELMQHYLTNFMLTDDDYKL